MNARDQTIIPQGGHISRCGIEAAAMPLVLQDIAPVSPGKPSTPMVQVGPGALKRANQDQGHPAVKGGVAEIAHRFHAPAFVRRLVKLSDYERRGGPLTGTPDAGERGENIEPATTMPVDDSEIGGMYRLGDESTPQSTGDADTPDLGKLVEAAHGEPFIELRALRANFPFLKIAQFPPQTVSKVLVQNVAQELQLPEGAAICRFAWQYGTDLIVTLQGGARVPQAADSPDPRSFGIGMEGMILNPDPGTWFYCKGIRSISAITPTAAGTIVNVQAYCGSYNVNPQRRDDARRPSHAT